eukprot:CAMPEP_0167797868 /NCGR_PEP_ID=MMETSP0111_2-20121227/15933_1 /TAXON_ID=91324 /ORGANISM="Lotharella globosa, Strain CCCM811" /LENGTH=79 /DNA_ID=CAMNT_0007692101 /DNA_START=260 /DNA_END=499 /DNA_ORIENTATION=-
MYISFELDPAKPTTTLDAARLSEASHHRICTSSRNGVIMDSGALWICRVQERDTFQRRMEGVCTRATNMGTQSIAKKSI